MEVAPRPLSLDAELLGQLEADETVMVRAEIPGIVAEIGFEEGQPVTGGQVLFRLDDADPRARLAEAKADLRLAQDKHARARSLARREVLSEAALTELEATLAAEQARVAAAQVALDRTVIRAPFDGVAGARLVSPGARIEAGQDLVRVEAIATLELVFTLPEQALPLARVGVPLELRVAPYPGQRFPAEVSFVAPSLDAASRRLLVKARVPNPDLRLRPGLFAEVEANLGRREDALLVPDAAIVYGGQGSFVWRLDADGAAQQAPVELGARQEGLVEVRAGLAPGDVIVVSGTNKLSAGQRVESIPVSDAPDAGPAPAPRPTDSARERSGRGSA
jgi:membrane fusion protein (multidrug efflux system)